MFEQVPEARHILNKDWKAKNAGKSPQDQLGDKSRSNGYTILNRPDRQAGMILDAADLGGIQDKNILFTVAVID